MKFKNTEHEQAYYALLEKMCAADCDVYRKSLAYLLTLDVVCRAHIEQLYNFEDCCIELTALEQCWQTGTSYKTTRLAFNLFTGHTSWCPDEDIWQCSVSEIFCCEYAPYYWEAIKIRYPEFTHSDEKT